MDNELSPWGGHNIVLLLIDLVKNEAFLSFYAHLKVLQPSKEYWEVNIIIGTNHLNVMQW